MKTFFLKTSVILFIITCVISCKAQILPLNTSLDDIPANAHLKDLNNELLSYVGNYNTNFQGNNIYLFITKVEDKLEKSANKNYYTDALIIKYIVKNPSGIVLQDTQNMVLNDQTFFNIVSMGIRPASGSVTFYYDGTNCGIGWGKIILKKLNATQISWEYRPNSLIVDSVTCPPSTNKTVYLPVTKDLIFTKQ